MRLQMLKMWALKKPLAVFVLGTAAVQLRSQSTILPSPENEEPKALRIKSLCFRVKQKFVSDCVRGALNYSMLSEHASFRFCKEDCRTRPCVFLRSAMWHSNRIQQISCFSRFCTEHGSTVPPAHALPLNKHLPGLRHCLHNYLPPRMT